MTVPRTDQDLDQVRRAAACRAFWSDHALNITYRKAIGDRPFTLKEFVTFVVAMPPDQFDINTGELPR
jgi:hypothetical protein